MITTDHKALVKCDPDVKIWRYMDLAKFELLLKNKSLFLCRSDKFSTPFEASTPRIDSENRRDEKCFFFNRPITPEEAKKGSEKIAILYK
jgi:hypothetical protein